jgi:hypothetical protein
MDPASADLHFRGFSREYRKGGRYGPHWFEYEEVSTEPRWLPLEGTFTRFGDVQPLLLEPDDRYVVMGPGDEATIAFDARQLPSLPPGWRRDFLLYSVGWVKDADLNTATGNTVYPLPFHDMSPVRAGRSVSRRRSPPELPERLQHEAPKDPNGPLGRSSRIASGSDRSLFFAP